ncbi:helix-turn-helix domain-containing protein [Microbacterium sp. MYb72]|uniref:helix-turn-helix domain-containing protein n=1 Tax=Microbacterium sp. MYb72 TaxID=1848693 RepID=UPI0011B0C8DB|nr:helix-turn-helix domain-containing protein [Microbacterium sp. MYb72]
MAKHLLPIDALIADQLIEGVRAAGLTYRQIASATGMSINRLGIILRKEPPPATVGEVGLIAGCFGATASEIILAAENVAPRRDDYDLVSNETINEFPDGDDADYDHA